LTTDFLIIGSGIAGLSLALKLSSLGSVLIITKKQKAESNTNYAQGGVAVVLSDDDSFELHIKDTLECGAGLSKREAVEKIVKEGPARIKELVEIGVQFTKNEGQNEAALELGKEGGHSRSRIVHAKDLTGKEIERALLDAISRNENIKILEYYFAIDFLTGKNFNKKHKEKGSKNKCYGIYALNVNTLEVEKIISRVTILASGGLGQVYSHTTNPAIATGDGVAMGYRAGCEIANMEFIQFHPTTLYEPLEQDNTQVFLISEAVRGAGAVLKTIAGEEFMSRYDERGSLAPRDIVARAIDNEMKKSGDPYVYLDLSPIGVERIIREFPNIYMVCKDKGIDITKEKIPVVPAAHYACGGVKTGLEGRTNINNLYACGEVTMTGVHGANRLASNSLLEAMVFSNAIFEDISQRKDLSQNGEKLEKIYKNILDWTDKGTENAEEWILISHDKREIKEIMGDYIGIVRNTYRLERAYRRIKMLRDEIAEFYRKTKVTVELLELRNLVTVAYLVIKSAMKRKESRGLHYMLDYPERDDKYLKDTMLQKKN
jgi:L-aspartate oxidase